MTVCSSHSCSELPAPRNSSLRMMGRVQGVWWRMEPLSPVSLGLHCCIFSPWHQTSRKVLYTPTFPDTPIPITAVLPTFSGSSPVKLSLMLGSSHTQQFLRIPSAPLCHQLTPFQNAGPQQAGEPAALSFSQPAIPTAWEEKDPPGLQQDFSSRSVALHLPESLEGGRASITVLCVAWPLVQASLNLSLPGSCCKDTVLLLSATQPPSPLSTPEAPYLFPAARAWLPALPSFPGVGRWMLLILPHLHPLSK